MNPRWGAPPFVVALLLAGVAAHADPQSDAIINKAIAAAKAARSLTATVEMNASFGEQKRASTATVRLLKPNFARMVMTGNTPGDGMELVLDGKDTYMVSAAMKQYQRMAGANKPAESPLSGLGGPILGAFFDGSMLKEMLAEGERKYGGKKTLGKTAYETVVSTRKEPMPMTLTAYFGASGLCEGMQFTMTPPTPPAAEPGAPKPEAPASQKMSWWLRNLKLNTPMTAKQFAFAAPKGFTAMKRPEPPDYEKGLVAVGKPAPDFNLPQVGGVNLALSDLLKEKKAVLVNFWFHG